MNQQLKNKIFKRTRIGICSFSEEFDPIFYARQLSNIGGESDLLHHYLTVGWKEALDPSPNFSTAKYLENYPDVAEADINPFEHYLTYGKYEGRIAAKSSFYLSNVERMFGSSNGLVALITSELQLLGVPGGIGAAIEELAKLLVVIDKKPIIFICCDAFISESSLNQARRTLNDEGIALELVTSGEYCTISNPGSSSYAIYKALSKFESKLETVVFPEYLGLGYHVVMAKKVGLKFLNTQLIANLHGSKRWATFTQGRFIGDTSGLWSDFLERQSVQNADLIVTPSNYVYNWYLENSWIDQSIPVVNIRNLTSIHFNEQETKYEDLQESDINHRDLVFIGKNSYKGLEFFLRSITLIESKIKACNAKLTIYGISADIEGLKAIKVLEKYAERWSFQFRISAPVNRYTLMEQLRLMTNPIVVVASEIENSPYAILDPLNAGYCTISSQDGGGPELFDSADLSEFLFNPKDPNSLACAIQFAMDNPLSKPKIKQSNSHCAEMWRNVFAGFNRPDLQLIQHEFIMPKVTIGITHFQREQLVIDAVKSAINQTYQGEIEIIVVDDGSKESQNKRLLRNLLSDSRIEFIEQENRYLGAARNTILNRASGELILFLDDDDLLVSSAIEKLVVALQLTKTDAVSIWSCNLPFDERSLALENIDRYCSTQKVSFITTSGPVSLAPFENRLGGPVALHRVSVLKEIGGFSEEYGLGLEDFELLVKYIQFGKRVISYPEPLYLYQVGAESMISSIDQEKSYRRVSKLLDSSVFQKDLADMASVLASISGTASNAYLEERFLKAIGSEIETQMLKDQKIAVQTRYEVMVSVVSKLGWEKSSKAFESSHMFRSNRGLDLPVVEHSMELLLKIYLANSNTRQLKRDISYFLSTANSLSRNELEVVFKIDWNFLIESFQFQDLIDRINLGALYEMRSDPWLVSEIALLAIKFGECEFFLEKLLLLIHLESIRYSNLYPEMAAGVPSYFSSVFKHFALHGFYENRKGFESLLKIVAQICGNDSEAKSSLLKRLESDVWEYFSINRDDSSNLLMRRQFQKQKELLSVALVEEFRKVRRL